MAIRRESIFARGQDGREVEIVQVIHEQPPRQERYQDGSLSDPIPVVPLVQLHTADGRVVMRMSDREYQVIHTGELLTVE